MDSEHYDLSAYPLFRSVLGVRSHANKHKRCLVLDPSGEANADVRQHADTLWKYVIQPAILDTNYEAYRAVSRERAIGQDVINALLDDDLIIAVLTFESPRVFYETALAQAAGRPLILLIEDGCELSFDPRNAKVMTYRLDTESVVQAVNVAQLQDLIREIEVEGAPDGQGFRPGAASLGAARDTGVTVYERSPKFSYDQRLDLIREAETRIDIMGVANLALALHPDTAEVIRAHAGGKIEIRVLQCAPSNAGLVAMLGARRTEDIAAVQQEIEAAGDVWRRIADAPNLDLCFTIRRAQSSLPMTSALITDKAVVATPYLRSRATAESPTLHAKAGDPYHAAMCEEFSQLWSEATTVFRADPAAQALRSRVSNAAANSAAYWAQAALPVAAASPALAPTEEKPVNGVRFEETPEPVHAANGNDAAESIHHKLFGSPLKNPPPTDDSPVNGSAHGETAQKDPAPKDKSLTVNERGHAIIRSVC